MQVGDTVCLENRRVIVYEDPVEMSMCLGEQGVITGIGAGETQIMLEGGIVIAVPTQHLQQMEKGKHPYRYHPD